MLQTTERKNGSSDSREEYQKGVDMESPVSELEGKQEAKQTFEQEFKICSVKEKTFE